MPGRSVWTCCEVLPGERTFLAEPEAAHLHRGHESITMRKLIEYTLLSLDGVFDNPFWSRDYRDDAYMKDGWGQVLASDAMLMGRGTYEGFARIWPGRTDPWANRINAMPKYVFSSTLASADWNNCTIIRGDIATEVARLKEVEGPDLITYGHGQFGQTLLKLGLLDALEVSIYPIIVGQGKSFFREGESARLKLVTSKTYAAGVVHLTYAPER
jgi:dihydrofolate reductase